MIWWMECLWQLPLLLFAWLCLWANGVECLASGYLIVPTSVFFSRVVGDLSLSFTRLGYASPLGSLERGVVDHAF